MVADDVEGELREHIEAGALMHGIEVAVQAAHIVVAA